MFTKITPLLTSEEEQIVTDTIAAGLAVHRELGPGFRERIYERALCLELEARKMKFETQKRIDVRYKSWSIPGQTVDLIVGEVLLVEVKAVSRLKKIHEAQVLSYLKTTNLRVGLLMNFNGVLFKHGLRRIVL